MKAKSTAIAWQGDSDNKQWISTDRPTIRRNKTMLFTKREVLSAAVIRAKKFHRRWGRVEDRAADDNAGRGEVLDREHL